MRARAARSTRPSESASVLSTTIDIAASAERLWRVMSDPERWHEWTPSITRITLFRGGPLAVGARAMTRQPKLRPHVGAHVEEHHRAISHARGDGAQGAE